MAIVKSREQHILNELKEINGDARTIRDAIVALEAIMSGPRANDGCGYHSGFHGTNSAALQGLKRMRALVPTGEMLKTDIVPFSGELFQGMGEGGVNVKYTSFVHPGNLDIALEYSRNRAGWTPEKGKEYLASVLELRKKFKEKGLDAGGLWMLGSEKGVETFLNNSEALANARLRLWESLTVQEKGFVSKPFPMAILTNKTEEPVYIGSDTRDILYPRLELDGLWVFVPRDKIEEVKAYLGHEQVYDINALELLDRLSTGLESPFRYSMLNLVPQGSLFILALLRAEEAAPHLGNP